MNFLKNISAANMFVRNKSKLKALNARQLYNILKFQKGELYDENYLITKPNKLPYFREKNKTLFICYFPFDNFTWNQDYRITGK